MAEFCGRRSREVGCFEELGGKAVVRRWVEDAPHGRARYTVPISCRNMVMRSSAPAHRNGTNPHSRLRRHRGKLTTSSNSKITVMVGTTGMPLQLRLGRVLRASRRSDHLKMRYDQ